MGNVSDRLPRRGKGSFTVQFATTALSLARRGATGGVSHGENWTNVAVVLGLAVTGVVVPPVSEVRLIGVARLNGGTA